MKTKKKLLQTGKYSYLVNLPKHWVRKLGWRTRQYLELTLKGNTITVKDFPN